MAWPLGDLVAIVREVYDIEGSIRRTADRFGISIGTIQGILSDPDQPRAKITLERIQGFYETARPVTEPGPYGSTKASSPYWLDSQIEDITPGRGMDSFLVNHQTESASAGANGWRSSGWRHFNDTSLAEYREEHGVRPQDIGDIRFGRRTF